MAPIMKRKVTYAPAQISAPAPPVNHVGEVRDRDGKLLLVGDLVRIRRRPGLNGCGELPAYTAEIKRIVTQKGRAVLMMRDADEDSCAYRAGLPEHARRLRRGPGHTKD